MSSLSLNTMYPQLTPGGVPREEIVGLYVHIPFCFHKCHYCDFYSITQQSPERMRDFVDRVLAEAGQWGGAYVRPRTIFFGGGTPSLLPMGEMRRLIGGLKERFDFSLLNEFTVEANPATVTLEYCQMLKEAGVDRLSFGAQSFNPADLKMLERHHDPEDVPKSLEMARGAGFERLNVDLIYAVPGQDLASWEATLEEAIGLGTRHMSCYGLTYELNTPMAVKKRLGHFVGAEESLELQMMHRTRERLGTLGIKAYEVSNYAVAGEECRHNLMYWRGENYLALGPSGASHVGGWRWKNRPHLGEWELAIDAGILPAAEVEVLSADRRAGELAMLMLRLTPGVDFADFKGRTGYDAREVYDAQLKQLAGGGLIIVDERGFRLTEKGLNVADAVAGEFLVVV
ncbi:MAG TPA: radical SAM family heme chaperone HemW [Tepidisphaeraceae bacterium]|jgi:oxygen-independent coproporphyrinogen-3 oxidase|nr:radical SAM family heme chaperone HemW [Tepidisphaeraceae bacterium]